MARPRLGIAAGSRLGAAAGAEVARAGGNAVDACLAAAVMGWVAEPFFASLGGSGFVSVRSPDGDVEVFDGNSVMPFTKPGAPGQGIARVYLDYSNGMYTGIGGGSVAVPGVLAAVHAAWERHGSVEWACLLAPAIAAARDGFPFPRTSAYYLSVTWQGIWSRYPRARATFASDGAPLAEGERFVQPELAEALTAIAEGGPKAFYDGQLGREVAEEISAHGGFLGAGDLERYHPVVREPVVAEVLGWRVQSNPPPALGGAVLVHMLELLENAPLEDPSARLEAFAAAESAAIGYRSEIHGDPSDVAGSVEAGLRPAPSRPRPSASTTHASAADSDGLVCSITESNGYGSGLIVHGVLLNNTLGEEELNPNGAHGLPPGARCRSNMAPTVASGPQTAVGLGSPGADRIVGAIAQVFLYVAVDRLELEEAVAAARAHVSRREEGLVLWYEPGLPGERLRELGYVVRPYSERNLFFGAEQAAAVHEDGSVDAAHDPRRSGGSALVA